MKMTPAKLEANRMNALLAGRPKGSIGEVQRYAIAFKTFLAKQIEKNKGPLIDAMIKEALNGNVEAFKALLDRAQGKPAQAVEIGGTDGQPIVFMPLELIQKHSLAIEGKQVTQQKIVDVESEIVK